VDQQQDRICAVGSAGGSSGPAAAYRRIWNSGSGSMFQFGKALPIREYFPEARDYKTYWKPAAFRSNVAVVRGGATP
jgi:hypothetical protein